MPTPTPHSLTGQKGLALARIAPVVMLLVALVCTSFPALPVSAQTTAVAPPTFSNQRGFYSSPFTLTLATTTSGATIRYTLDGSEPKTNVGTIYSGPINITTTTAVRAIAYKGSDKSSVVTHTYLFLADVRNQSDTPLPGWPAFFAQSDASGTYPADYEMDGQVWNHSNNAGKYEAVMKSLPSLSINTDLPNLWDSNYGIYYNPSAKEPFEADPLKNKWERPISMEWINPDGTTGFEVTGGMRINGQASRRPHRQPKKNFRVYFRGTQYGTTKLDFRLFDYGEAVGKFDRLIIRNGGNRSWSYFDRDQRKNADYINDEWARRAWLQMGNLAPHGTYVHLYLNGMYWGLYNVTERLDEKFLQAYLGGLDTEYAIIESDEDYGDLPTSDHAPTVDAWNNLLAEVAGTAPITDTAKYLTISSMVNVVSLADYFVHTHYIGKTDWPHHNWNAFRKLVGSDRRFKFVPWDNDSGLNNVTENITLLQDTKGPNDAPSRVFSRLMTNPEFRQLVADRLYKHVVDPTGALTPARCAALYTQLTTIIDQAVIGESARWGDYARDKYPKGNDAPKGFPAYLYSRDLPDNYTEGDNNPIDDNQQLTWLDVKNDKLSRYCPQRSTNVTNQYLANGWYQTAVKPPLFSKLGGAVAANYNLTISNSPNNNLGTIYYTTDGTDPRQQFGAVSPTAQNGGSTEASVTISTVTYVKARVLNGDVWSPLAEYAFYPPQPFEHLVINEVHYSPLAPPPSGSIVPDPDDYEFLELYNKGNTPLRLDNLSFSSGLTYRFPPFTTLGAGKFLVLASKPSFFQSRYQFAAFGNYRGNLSNFGEPVELRDAVGNLIDAVSYLPGAPWPPQANGTGKSLSLESPTLENSNPVNWFASAQTGGTPGAANGSAPTVDARLGPLALDFGSQHLNEVSATRVVTLTNAGTTALLVNSITASGDFAQANNCPSGLAPDASCTISVRFTPTALGQRNGTLTLATNAPSPLPAVNLVGVGDELPRILSASASSLAFGDQAITTASPPQQVTITNSGPGKVSITGITASGDFASSHTCPDVLQPGASCTASVAFTPTSLGTHSGTLTVASNADAGPLTVTLGGNGVPLPRILGLSADSLAFAALPVGATSAAQTVTVSNIGPSAVAIGSITASGDFAATDDCPASLAVGGSCTVSVTFTPTAGGARSGALTVASDADGGPLSVALGGAGITSLGLSATTLNFGEQRIGSTSGAQAVTITNNGTETVTGLAFALSGPFTHTSDCGATLAPGASCTVSVAFAPTAEGPASGALSVASSATLVPQQIALSGTGTTQTPTREYTLYLPVVRQR